MGAQPFSLKFALHRSWLPSSLCTSALAASSSSALAAHWQCQQGLDQDGCSNSLLLPWGGNQYVLYISNTSTAARLHHRVRKLHGILGSFDILHHTMGAVFGFDEDFGTSEYAILQRKQLRNLGVRDGSVITIVKRPPSLDSDGEEIPTLVSSSESEAEQPPRRRRRRRRRPLRQCSRVHTEGRPSRLTAKDFILRFQARTPCERSRLRRSCHATHAQWV